MEEEKQAASQEIFSNPYEEAETLTLAGPPDHGWKKVVYPKRQKKLLPSQARPSDPSSDLRPNGTHVFASVEKKAHERRRALESAAAEAADAARSRAIAAVVDDDEEESGAEGEDGGKENGVDEVKKVKVKKPKKPKITVQEAASKIDPADLSVFLAEQTSSYESQPDIQLMRFADYFARAFSSVSASQFPWTKMFKESPVSKIINVPWCHISESVIKISADWIGQRPVEPLCNFILWSLDCIFADMPNQQSVAKGSKKPFQQPSSKAQVAIFVVLAMTLRRKPDALINILPVLRENPKYQELDKLPVIIWVIGQASQGDLAIGMHGWVHNLLPLACGKTSTNPQVRDLVLQLVERILSGPKARPVLLNGAVRKGERLVPPSALELLMRATFPAPSARIKATERFEAIYPTLRELALAGSPGSKSIKPVSQQLLPAMAKATRENNPDLSKEVTDIFIWCLSQNKDCFKQWEKIHLENVEASIAVLHQLSDEWKKYSAKFSPPDSLRETLYNIIVMNKEALADGEDYYNPASIKEADKYCKVILRTLTRRFSCMKVGVCFLTVAVAVGAFVLSPNLESWDWKNLYVI